MPYVIIALLALILRKLKRIDLVSWGIHSKTQEMLANEFAQLEALQGLYVDLKLQHSLLATRKWAGSPDFLGFLAKRVLSARPDTTVECSSGVSTIITARALQQYDNGHVHSLEHDPVHAEKTRREVARHWLQDWATAIDAPLYEIENKFDKQHWYDIRDLPDIPIDLLTIDGPPRTTNNMARYPSGLVLISRLSASGMVLLDDALRNEEQAAVQEWITEFPRLKENLRDFEKGITVISSAKT